MKTAVCILAILAAIPCRARIITVDDDAPADFNNIQAAIDDATNGDTVEVQPGTYTGLGNRDIDFLGRAITVTGTNPGDPNTVAQTVIDCNNQGRGFYFHNNEDANSVLNGLTVTNAVYSAIVCGDGASPLILNCRLIKNVGIQGGGISCGDSSPTIANCTLAANQATDVVRGAICCSGGAPSLTACLLVGNSGYGVACIGGKTDLINCVIVGNRVQGSGGGIFCLGGREPEVTIANCIIRDNTSSNGDQICLTGWMNMLGEYFIPELSVSFSNVQGGTEAIEYREIPQDLQEVHWGEGNIDADPCFVDPGFWDPNGTPEDANDDFWVDGRGDYHLKSQAGRWDANEGRWTIDEVTSPCIDTGDPMAPIGLEPFPNGGRINMGAYGGTAEASKSYFGKPACETIVAGDINGDCAVNFVDFGLMALHWMEEHY
ncbi:MAG: right-handed parallel beta-helix repeat-containing protein [Sedimentisphaerales bacterium]|nr:right-handed parallel beta-helix repeat-containing protein [Sedimentisphaerales bacterium]